MMINFTRSEKDAVLFHGAFAVVCAALLAAPVPSGVGIKLLALVVLYNIALPALSMLRGHAEWTGLWKFAFLVSVFQVFPDWFLSAQLGVLVFPEDGLFKIGTVSGYMAGLWAIPFFIIGFLGLRVEARLGGRSALIAVALASLAVFGMSEMTSWMLPSWYAVNLKGMAGHVALYILVPEIILGLSFYRAFRSVEGQGFARALIGGFLVMLLYLGSACFFYFLVEKIILG
jgi:hypothetical protein